jgi:hypothetical protein
MPRQERPRSWQLCSHLVRYPTKSLFAAAKRAALRGHLSMKSIATVTNAFNEAAGNSFSMNKRRSAPETCRDIHKSSSSITGDHLHVAFRALPYHCMRSCKYWREVSKRFSAATHELAPSNGVSNVYYVEYEPHLRWRAMPRGCDRNIPASSLKQLWVW